MLYSLILPALAPPWKGVALTRDGVRENPESLGLRCGNKGAIFCLTFIVGKDNKI
jgi:hypothetical protein